MDKYIVTRDEIDRYAGVSGTHFSNQNGRRSHPVIPAHAGIHHGHQPESPQFLAGETHPTRASGGVRMKGC